MTRMSEPGNESIFGTLRGIFFANFRTLKESSFQKSEGVSEWRIGEIIECPLLF